MPRPLKGTPTSGDLFVLYMEILRAHGQSAALGRGRRAIGPLHEFEATSMGTIRKLLKAGWLAPALGKPRGYWELTGQAVVALDEWRKAHAGFYGIPANYQGLSHGRKVVR